MPKVRKELFEKYRADIVKKMEEIIREMSIDPVRELLKIYFEFSDLLKKYQGKERFTYEFDQAVKNLGKRQDQMEALRPKYTFEYKQRLQQDLIDLQFEKQEIDLQLYFLNRQK